MPRDSGIHSHSEQHLAAQQLHLPQLMTARIQQRQLHSQRPIRDRRRVWQGCLCRCTDSKPSDVTAPTTSSVWRHHDREVRAAGELVLDGVVLLWSVDVTWNNSCCCRMVCCAMFAAASSAVMINGTAEASALAAASVKRGRRMLWHSGLADRSSSANVDFEGSLVITSATAESTPTASPTSSLRCSRAASLGSRCLGVLCSSAAYDRTVSWECLHNRRVPAIAV